MIEMHHEHIDRIWSSLSHWIPEKMKLDAAVDFINSLQELGVEDSAIKQAAEFDPKYEEAVNAVYGDEEDDDDYYDEYSDNNE